MLSAQIARVALDVPLPGLFDYRCVPHAMPEVGDWVIVPWGTTRRVGLVLARVAESSWDEQRVRPVEALLPGMPTMPADWIRLIEFAARYYHAGLGEVALPSVPKLLRRVPTERDRGVPSDRARERYAQWAKRTVSDHPAVIKPLNAEQKQALLALQAGSGHAVHLLFGITGSGKTEVYFEWLAERLAADARSQVLVLVPEIALTPQLAERLRARFPGESLAILHSDMPDAERAAYWLATMEGRVRIILGTRLAVLAPIPYLAAIVVDEEHDASYKQQEGARYSARDLAIVLASQRQIPVVLGSATPAIESWFAAQRGRYRIVMLRERASGFRPPHIERVMLRGARLQHGLTPVAQQAIEHTLAAGRQALLFLNRRGYAPVLACAACGWLSRCVQCDAYRVLHRVGAVDRSDSGARPARYQLICHHCAAAQRVPRLCPECGNVDLAGLGRGTQRLEEGLQSLFPGARIGRLDRDVARRRGAAQSVLAAVHAGDLDLLVGTQMLAKGHDFRRLGLVVVMDADAGLFAADFRAPERLFATLMQVAGRAGRHQENSRVLIQTRYPQHSVYEALAAHDYERFVQAQLEQRAQAGLPPYTYQALLTASATSQEAAVAFLDDARHQIASLEAPGGDLDAARAMLTVCDPVPMPLAQVRGQARAQMLLESVARPALHAVLTPWIARLQAQRTRVAWQLVVDPLEI
jgi:primosomal protein N' (replication factor Y)